MHDPVDIRRRIDRLVACRPPRRYGQLLADGQVIHEVEDGPGRRGLARGDQAPGAGGHDHVRTALAQMLLTILTTTSGVLAGFASGHTSTSRTRPV